jgi:hypothetical protein
MFLKKVVKKKDILCSIHFPYTVYGFGIIKKNVNAYIL